MSYGSLVQVEMNQERIQARYAALEAELDERGRRIWAATEAALIGFGGVCLVSKATGIAESTIRLGRKDLSERGKGRPVILQRRIRRQGGGRRSLVASDPEIVSDLELLVEPTTRGHPMTPLRWTLKSTRRLAEELTKRGHPASHAKVGELLDQLGYSLQGTRKQREGSQHPDRNAQFEYIVKQVGKFQKRQQPVVSVDTKKKELVGDFSNSGREFRPKGEPVAVRVHDFVDAELGKAIPYGVYDLTANAGWVSVGITHDTAQFSVNTLRTWWQRMGIKEYPDAGEILITADGGGSNASRNRLWKTSLQELADETGLKISVSHLPPGTSKWNKIEHRMFCWITENWRGKPLSSHAVIINLIANTTTRNGLTIRAAIDRRKYTPGIKVSDDELASLNHRPATFHGEWNYTISPRY